MTVNPILPVSVTIAASANPVCAGTSVTFTATPTNGGTTPVYQWKVNGSNVGTDNAVYSYTPANGDIIACLLSSNATCPSGNPATSNTVTMTVNPNLPVSVSIATGSQAILYEDFNYTPPAYIGGNGNAGSSSNNWTSHSVTTGQTTTIDVLSGNLSYVGLAPSSGNKVYMFSNGNTMSRDVNRAFTYTATALYYSALVNVLDASQIPTLSPDYFLHFGATSGSPVTVFGGRLGIKSVNSAANYRLSIQNTSGGTPNYTEFGQDLSFGTTYLVVVKYDRGVAPTVAYLWVNPVSLGGGEPAGFVSNASGTSLFPQFASICLRNSATTPKVEIDEIRVGTTWAEVTPTGSRMPNITLNPALLPGSTNTICAGASVTFIATPTNGGTTPAYQWKNNGTDISGATSTSYTSSTLTDGDVITCMLTSNATCATGNPATSNAVTMTVNPILPVSVAIAASANPVCAGTSVTFTATPTNGGPTPAYQWKKGGTNISGATGATYTSSTLANGDVITCTLTSNATCATGNPATSNAVTMTINPILPVSLTIAASANPVCAGTSVTFTATPTNGGTTPAFQWKNGGSDVAGATVSTYTSSTLSTGDVITCLLTSNETCISGSPATSNSVTMTVNPILPVSVAIAASANPVCAGTSVTFTATPTNGGTMPAYQWKVNGSNVGTDNSIYSYTPANGDIVVCLLTSNATCPSGNPATSNTVTMTVNPILSVSVTIAASANPVCAGTSVT
ncbi:MAG: hypothetical protein WCP32_19190, partial [Bacteroidota bacterium]